MNRFLLGLTAVCALAACAAPTSTQQAQVQYVQACTAYGSAFAAALTLREQGKLSAQAIAQISILDQQITPICTGPLPADPTTATLQVTAAVTTIAVIEAVKAQTGQTIAVPPEPPAATPPKP